MCGHRTTRGELKARNPYSPIHDHGVQGSLPALVGTSAETDSVTALRHLTREARGLDSVHRRPATRRQRLPSLEIV